MQLADRLIILIITYMDQQLLQSNIINELGIENLPEEKKVELVENISQAVEKKLMLRLLETLNEEQYAELTGIEKDEDRMAKLMEMVPNFDDIMKEEIVAIKQELIDMVENDPELQ